MKNKFFVLLSALFAAFAVMMFMPDTAAAVVKPPPTPAPPPPVIKPPPAPKPPVYQPPPQQLPVYQPPQQPPAYQPNAYPSSTCKNCSVQQISDQYYPTQNIYEPSQTVNYYYEVNHYQDVNHAYHVQHNYYVRNNHYVYDYTQVHYSDTYYPTQYVRYPDTYVSNGAPQYVHYAPKIQQLSSYSPCNQVVYANGCNNCGKPGATSYTNAAGRTTYSKTG